jgi:hypothetical protein
LRWLRQVYGWCRGVVQMTKPLFSLLLGNSFDELPVEIRKVHDGGDKLLVGRCDVLRGEGFWSRLLASATSLPPAGLDQEISVTIVSTPRGERWIRSFGRKRMSSTLAIEQGLLVENLGPVTFTFNLQYCRASQEIEWALCKVKVLQVPVPVSWFSAVAARESHRDGRYRFDVTAALPVVGLLVQYRGWLSV